MTPAPPARAALALRVARGEAPRPTMGHFLRAMSGFGRRAAPAARVEVVERATGRVVATVRADGGMREAEALAHRMSAEMDRFDARQFVRRWRLAGGGAERPGS